MHKLWYYKLKKFHDFQGPRNSNSRTFKDQPKRIHPELSCLEQTEVKFLGSCGSHVYYPCLYKVAE